MAYMNQERKATISQNLKPILTKYGVRGSLSVRNHSTIVLTLKSGSIDFVENFIETDAARSKILSNAQIARIRENQYLDVNPYWFHEHFTGVAKEFMNEAFAALKSAGWYDKSNAQDDYFDTAYCVDLRVGKWNKPYVLESK